MSPELIILLVFIVVVSMITALVGAFVGLRLASRARMPDRFRHDRDKPPPEDAASAPPSEPAAAPPQARNQAAPLRTENHALRAYQAILESRGLSGKEQDTMTRDFAKLFEAMRERMETMASEDQDIETLIAEARDALFRGDFLRASQSLNRVGDQAGGRGRDFYRVAAAHLGTAAAAKSMAGDLDMAQMNYGEAARQYQGAVDILPADERDLLAEYLNKHGTAAYQAGNLYEATRSFERAVRVLEEALGENHPDVATALNNLALLHYTQGNYAAAEPLYRRALEVDERVLGADHQWNS